MELAMSNRIFTSNVSIVKNTKGEVALKKDPEGSFSAGNVIECYRQLLAISQRLSLPVNKYSLYIVEGGTEVVLLANRFGNPYIGVLPKRGDGDGSRKGGGVVKLA
jgi:hypothetical protein